MFRFKQFELDQTGCAMKVGTDGVLLGSWANLTHGRALDIGTGTGLIALMLAQRNENLSIDAIELDSSAYHQATLNFSNSPWTERLRCIQGDIRAYTFIDQHYDIIICNPPYFVDSTKARTSQRTIARHTDSLSFESLIGCIKRLLHSNGNFAIVLPHTEGTAFIELTKEAGLHLNRICQVHPKSNKPVKRYLMEFSFQKKPLKKESLVIELGQRHDYSKEYISLTKDFYLQF